MACFLEGVKVQKIYSYMRSLEIGKERSHEKDKETVIIWGHASLQTVRYVCFVPNSVIPKDLFPVYIIGNVF